MDFNLNQEQQLLADSVARFAERNDGFTARRHLAAGKTLALPDHWQALTELGLPGLIVPEELGGMGGNPVDTLVVMEQLGKRLLGEPFLSYAVLGAALISAAGNDAQRSQLLPEIATGGLRIALAAMEQDSGFDLAAVRTLATRKGDQYILNGTKCIAPHANQADAIIVTARTSGKSGDEQGISLFLVTPGSAGLTLRDHPTIDGQHAADITFTDVAVDAGSLLGSPGSGFDPMERAVEAAIAASCAEAVGLATVLIDTTNAFLRTRKQFGQEIGRFQSLQHRAAEMQIALEHIKSAAAMAASALQIEDRTVRRRAISAAKSLTGRHGRFVSHQAVQLHGAIGTTDELSVGHYYKRLHSIDVSWGTHRDHLARYSALMTA